MARIEAKVWVMQVAH